MRLTDIDGKPVLLRGEDVVMVSCGHCARKPKSGGIVAPTPGDLRLANGNPESCPAGPVPEQVPAYVLQLSTLPGAHAVGMNDDNLRLLEEAIETPRNQVSL